LVSPAIAAPVIVSEKPFTEHMDAAGAEWLNSLPVGTDVYHVDCDSGLLVGHYLRTTDQNGDKCDWINLSETSAAKGPIDPNLATGSEASMLECMGQGSHYWQITEVESSAGVTSLCKYLWIKDCDGNWTIPTPKLELINRPDLSCKPELVCGVLNIPTSFIWRRTSPDLDSQLIPRGILTPVALDLTKADTPGKGGHGDGLCISCTGLWHIEATIVLTHPLDLEPPEPPWSEDSNFGLFVGNGQGQSNPGFLRQQSTGWSQDGLWHTVINVSREIPIVEGACYYNYVFWEDVAQEDLAMVTVGASTLKATFRGCMPDSYDGDYAQ